MFVDSHCHVSPSWYEPLETLLFQMDSHDIAQAVLIQMLGQFDNDYQQQCVKRFPDRLASVVGIDVTREDAAEVLRQLADQGASGVRFRPTTRSTGKDDLAIWRTAESCGLAVSCVGNSTTFSAPEFEAIVQAFPKLKIVLEHLGATSKPDAGEAEREARRKVFALSKYANVYLKVTGLGEISPRKPKLEAGVSPFEPTELLHEALTSFGAERLMWGSDFPVVASREGYGNAFRWSYQAFSEEIKATKELIFGGTAQKVFKLPRNLS